MTIIQMHTHTGEKSYFFITNKQCGKAHATAQEIQNALENKENIEEIIIYNIKIDITTPKNNPIPIFIHLFFIQSPSLKKRSHLTSLMHSFHLWKAVHQLVQTLYL